MKRGNMFKQEETVGKETHEKMFNCSSHEGNLKENYSEILLHASLNSYS